MKEPVVREHLAQMMIFMLMPEHRLSSASDYPHWDFQ